MESIKEMFCLPFSGLDDPGFEFRKEQDIFLSSKTSSLALGATQPPIQWAPRTLSPGIKLPGPEADQSPSCSAKFKSEWSYTSTTAVCLHVMYRDNLAFFFTTVNLVYCIWCTKP
jgi:hypothetical protein